MNNLGNFWVFTLFDVLVCLKKIFTGVVVFRVLWDCYPFRFMLVRLHFPIQIVNKKNVISHCQIELKM